MAELGFHHSGKHLFKNLEPRSPGVSQRYWYLVFKYRCTYSFMNIVNNPCLARLQLTQGAFQPFLPPNFHGLQYTNMAEKALNKCVLYPHYRWYARLQAELQLEVSREDIPNTVQWCQQRHTTGCNLSSFYSSTMVIKL